MIQLTNLAKSFGGQTLFNDVNLKLSHGQKIGFVGRNGSGKSTLFKIILGEESYDSGDVSIPKNYMIGTLRQHLIFTEKTVREECALVLPEDEQWNFYKIEKLLFGLGFTYIFTDDDIPSDTLDYPVPHSDYTKLGTKQDGEWGLYGMLGIDIFKGFYLFGLGGVTFQKEIELAQSNVTGYYTQSDEYQTHGMYGGGIRLGLGETLCLQVELDNRRGVTGMIGFVW